MFLSLLIILINNNDTLKGESIEAIATNTSTARTAFSKVASIDYTTAGTHSATVTFKLHFYVGEDTSADFSITASSVTFSGAVIDSEDIFTDLDDLISQINTQASNNNVNIVATESNGKLVLQTTNFYKPPIGKL